MVVGRLRGVHQIDQIHPTTTRSLGRDVLGLVLTTATRRGAQAKASWAGCWRRALNAPRYLASHSPSPAMRRDDTNTGILGLVFDRSGGGIEQLRCCLGLPDPQGFGSPLENAKTRELRNSRTTSVRATGVRRVIPPLLPLPRAVARS